MKLEKISGNIGLNLLEKCYFVPKTIEEIYTICKIAESYGIARKKFFHYQNNKLYFRFLFNPYRNELEAEEIQLVTTRKVSFREYCMALGYKIVDNKSKDIEDLNLPDDAIRYYNSLIDS